MKKRPYFFIYLILFVLHDKIKKSDKGMMRGMKNITVIRKRYIPNEEVDISGDRILLKTDDILMTKWRPIKPRGDFSWGMSYVDLHDNYKISRFYDENDNFLFWYCDILEIDYSRDDSGEKYIFTDLLIDIIVNPDGTYEIKDIDEINEALEKGLIDKRQYDTSVFAMDRLVENIQKGAFPPAKFDYKKYENKRVDLHIHSYFSDGTYSPEKIVDMAKEANLSAIALTDHDTIDGIDEAQAAAKSAGIEFVPGVEFSARKVHILGYFPNGRIHELKGFLEKYLESRRERARKMIEKLNSLKVPVTYEEIVKEAGGERFIGRVHFARVILKKGYATSIKDAFNKWIAEDRPGYVEKSGASAEEIIEKIDSLGGVAVLAHPNQLKMGKSALDDLVKHFISYGLKGIEVFYGDNSVSETRDSMRLASDNGLIMTGGSDFHGDNKPGIAIGYGRGDLNVPYECVSDLKNSF